MKHYMTTLLALALIVLGTSCRKEKDINLASRVVLSQTEEITIISQGAPDFRFEVESDGDWVVVAPRWIKATPAYGNGNDVVTLSFQDNWTDGVENGTRHGQVNVECASGATSFVVCQQGDPAKPSDEIKAITIGEFITLPENGQIYELTGIVANISNMTYGNFDLVDETGSIYIYGVLDPDGNPKNFATLDVEEGDQLTIQGSLGHYGDKLEVINAQYISHVKSLVRCLDASPVKIAKEEGEVTLRVQYKGEDLKVFVNANWLTFRGMGKELETTLVNFQAQANTEATARTAKVTLSSSKGDKVSSITVEIRQDPDTGGGGGTMTDMSTITGAADDGRQGGGLCLYQLRADGGSGRPGELLRKEDDLLWSARDHESPDRCGFQGQYGALSDPEGHHLRFRQLHGRYRRICNRRGDRFQGWQLHQLPRSGSNDLHAGPVQRPDLHL